MGGDCVECISFCARSSRSCFVCCVVLYWSGISICALVFEFYLARYHLACIEQCGEWHYNRSRFAQYHKNVTFCTLPFHGREVLLSIMNCNQYPFCRCYQSYKQEYVFCWICIRLSGLQKSADNSATER